jgi:LysM repeat protein
MRRRIVPILLFIAVVLGSMGIHTMVAHAAGPISGAQPQSMAIFDPAPLTDGQSAWTDANFDKLVNDTFDLANQAHVTSIWVTGALDGVTDIHDPATWTAMDHLFTAAQQHHLSIVFDLGMYRDWCESQLERSCLAPSDWQDFLPFIVTRYAKQPALQAWSLGGNLPVPAWGQVTMDDLIGFVRGVSDGIAAIDPDHPITTGALSNLSWSSGIVWRTLFSLPHITWPAIAVSDARDQSILLPAVAQWAQEHNKPWLVGALTPARAADETARAKQLQSVATSAMTFGADGLVVGSLGETARDGWGLTPSHTLLWASVQKIATTEALTPAASSPTSVPSGATSDSNVPPSGCPQYVTVPAGSSISLLAANYNITWQTLWQANPQVKDPGLLTVGQELCVPVAPASAGPTKTASPPPTTTTTDPTREQVQQMIRQVFGSYADQALRVAYCESGYNPRAYNPIVVLGGHARGVFQIIDVTWASTSQHDKSPYDAWANINAANEIFSRDGHRWYEWVCQP